MKPPVILLALIFFSSATGQSLQLIDSLERHVKGYGPDEKAYALYILVGYYQRSDQQKTLWLRQQ